MRWLLVFAFVALIAACGAAAAVAAPQSDAQVKAAVTRGIAAVNHLKGKPLGKALATSRVALTKAAPSSAASKHAKSLALRGFAKASLAAVQQVKADAALTKMQYDGANSATALAKNDLAAAVALLKQAARLLGITSAIKPA